MKSVSQILRMDERALRRAVARMQLEFAQRELAKIEAACTDISDWREPTLEDQITSNAQYRLAQRSEARELVADLKVVYREVCEQTR